MKRVREDGLQKPRNLKPSVKRLIFTRAIENRQTPRLFLANQLIKEINDSGEVPPTLETCKRYISNARQNKNPKDKPWSLSALNEYSEYFPISSIPFLMDYLYLENDIDGNSPIYGENLRWVGRFTIRKAIWLVRLQLLTGKYISPRDEIMNLSLIADAYCSSEIASEVMNEEYFDSSELDEHVLKQDIDAIWANSVYSQNVVRTKDRNKSK